MSDKIASKTIRAELLRRGMSRGDLAALIGYKVGTVANVISGNDRHGTVRRAIESCLSIKVWTQATAISPRQEAGTHAQTATPTI